MKKIVLLSAVFTALLVSSCEEGWHSCVKGNGNRTTETRDLDSFSRIQMNGDFEVRVDTGEVLTATIEADQNLMDLIVTRISGDKLIIESKDGHCLEPTHSIEIKVTVPYLTEIYLNGSGYVYCYGMETEELTAVLAGSGQIDCYELISSTVSYTLEGSGLIISQVTAENTEARIEGSGEIRLTGNTVNEELSIIGSGRIKADQLNADICSVYISGSGIVDTWVNDALDVNIAGSGIVYYSGDPAVNSEISGSGKVIKQ